VRCFKCRTYINPFVTFIEGGRRWQCNICKCLNQVHHEYFCPLDANGQRKDLAERKELTHGSIEFIAPQEYMARVPQPPAYLFLIDVSYNAVKSGMLATVTKTISGILDKLPGDDRTRIGFIIE
jgi:protein transport protein SEC24